MEKSDIEFALRSSDQEKWYLEEADILYYMNQGISVIAEDGGRRIGMATAALYDRLAWIGNVLVLQEERNRGVGNEMVRFLIDELQQNGVSTIGLYAYDRSMSLYLREGFTFDTVLWEMCIHETHGKGAAAEGSVGEIVNFDRTFFRHDRSRMLEHLASRKGARLIVMRDTEISGYLICSPSSPDYGSEIAPFIAERGKIKEMLASLDAPLPFHIYVPEINIAYIQENFRCSSVRRMHRGYLGKREEMPVIDERVLSPGTPDGG